MFGGEERRGQCDVLVVKGFNSQLTKNINQLHFCS